MPPLWNDTARLYHLFLRTYVSWKRHECWTEVRVRWLLLTFLKVIFSVIYFFWEEVQTSTTMRQRSLWSFIGIFKQQIFNKYFQNMVRYLRPNFPPSFWGVFSQWLIIKWCCNMVLMASKTSFKIKPLSLKFLVSNS